MFRGHGNPNCVDRVTKVESVRDKLYTDTSRGHVIAVSMVTWDEGG